MDRRRYLASVGLGGTLSVAGCVRLSDTDPTVTGTVGTLTVAAGTTAHDSGLLADLNPGFRQLFGTRVKVVPRGTGAALRTARDGDCDAVVVHARPLEDAFLRSGHGLNRRSLMANDFLVVGPPADPAGAAGVDPVAAFRAIAAAEAPFLSRGDRSGTHVRERRIWERAGVDPEGDWYRETGQGMGDTLAAAAQAGAYTLVDRGTFLTASTDGLAAHVDRGLDDPPPLLRNEYSVVAVNPARHDVGYPAAMAYVGYLTGPAQARIDAFRADGRRAFRATGLQSDPGFEQYVPSDWP